MYEIPKPLTLEEIIMQGGIEGSEEAYEKNDGFDYGGLDNAFLYYGGDEFSGGKPYSGLYYELYANGKLEMYGTYKNGMPIEGYYTFYENGKIKRYSFFSQDKKNNFCYYYDKEGNLERVDIWKNGRLTQEYLKNRMSQFEK